MLSISESGLDFRGLDIYYEGLDADNYLSNSPPFEILMRLLKYIFSVLVIASAIVAADRLIPKAEAPVPTVTPMVAIEKMGDLVSLRVNYADVIDVADRNSIDMPFNREIRLGKTTVLMVAKGDCTLATNLSLAKFGGIDHAAHTITVTLPRPRALSVRVNHDTKEKGGSYFYSMTEQGMTTLFKGDDKKTGVYDKALAKAQSELQAACTSSGNIAAAKQNAEVVLRSMYLSTGWKPSFIWQ